MTHAHMLKLSAILRSSATKMRTERRALGHAVLIAGDQHGARDCYSTAQERNANTSAVPKMFSIATGIRNFQPKPIS